MRPVFCGNFDYETRQSELERLFAKYGRVDRVDMKTGTLFFCLCFFLLNLFMVDRIIINRGSGNCHLEKCFFFLDLFSIKVNFF